MSERSGWYLTIVGADGASLQDAALEVIGGGTVQVDDLDGARLVSVSSGGDPLVWLASDGTDAGSVEVHVSAAAPFGAAAALIEQFDCRVLGEPVGTICEQVTGEAAAEYVWGALLRPSRRLPLVAVSATEEAGCDGDGLQRALAGLARVASFDAEGLAALTRAAGRRLACPPAAARLYWPGWSPDDDERDHPLWTAETGSLQALEEMQRLCRIWLERQSHAGRALIDRLRSQAAERREAEHLRERILAEVRGAEVAPLEEQLARRTAELASLRAAEARATALHDENQRLEGLSERQKKKIALLERHIDDQTTELAHYRQNRLVVDDGGINGGNGGGRKAAAETIRSVRAAVDRAGRELEHLRFLRSAGDSALASNYERPHEVWEVFEKMEKVGAERARRPLGKAVAQKFADLGVEYTPAESSTTMGKWGSERSFTDEQGRIWTMDAHIKLGGGRGKTILRIHLDWDEERKCWLIGHVGGHLTNTWT